jgi:hypothetical protein
MIQGVSREFSSRIVLCDRPIPLRNRKQIVLISSLLSVLVETSFDILHSAKRRNLCHIQQIPITGYGKRDIPVLDYRYLVERVLFHEDEIVEIQN